MDISIDSQRLIEEHQSKNKPKKKFDKTIIFIILAIIVVAIFASNYMTEETNTINNEANNAEQNQIAPVDTNPNSNKKVKLETNHGDIIIELYNDMPITTGNFEKLVNQDFYDGVIFHRIINGFMIQGGDPEGTGRGGPGYNIEDEFTHQPANRNIKYTISMANAGPNTGGSQFFINLVDNSFLDDKHPAFGIVTKGQDIVDKIGKVETDQTDRPLVEVKILKATIL